MINILSYVGMNLQSEVCLWTMLGLVRTIFDATLFKVNANLKQVWQMNMPEELSMSVQRMLRTMVSGIILVQCFTVYVYLASYIVLLYPVFLEERPALVLPWLLLAAIRNLLCELTSLALGLGTCLLLGTAKPPCIKFLVSKFATIMPAFYMWTLVYSYYHTLKVASAFKTFPAMLPENGRDYGLELAVRRRRTKSLFGEDLLRKKLVSGFYPERSAIKDNLTKLDLVPDNLVRNSSCLDFSAEETLSDGEVLRDTSTRNTDIGTYEDWFGSEIIIPRSDRILEQFVIMLLRIGAYLNKDGTESLKSNMFNSAVTATCTVRENIEAMTSHLADTPPLVGNSKGYPASYLRDYPQIFMKKLGSEIVHPSLKISQITETDGVKGFLAATGKSNIEINDLSSDIKWSVGDEKTDSTIVEVKVEADDTVPIYFKENSNDILVQFDQVIKSNENNMVHSPMPNIPASKEDEMKQNSKPSVSASEKVFLPFLPDLKEESKLNQLYSEVSMMAKPKNIASGSTVHDKVSSKLSETINILNCSHELHKNKDNKAKENEKDLDSVDNKETTGDSKPSASRQCKSTETNSDTHPATKGSTEGNTVKGNSDASAKPSKSNNLNGLLSNRNASDRNTNLKIKEVNDYQKPLSLTENINKTKKDNTKQSKKASKERLEYDLIELKRESKPSHVQSQMLMVPKQKVKKDAHRIKSTADEKVPTEVRETLNLLSDSTNLQSGKDVRREDNQKPLDYVKNKENMKEGKPGPSQ